jgi:hypothetical protein
VTYKRDVVFGLVNGFDTRRPSLQFTLFLTLDSSHYTRTEASQSAVRHQSSGTGFQRQTFLFLGSRTVPAEQSQQMLTRSSLPLQELPLFVTAHVPTTTIVPKGSDNGI